MSLEFYCRIQRHLKNIIKKNIGVLLSVEFFCLWSSTVSNPQKDLIAGNLASELLT
jgi:hypothetical protein